MSSFSFLMDGEELATAKFVPQEDYQSLLANCAILTAPNTSRSDRQVHIDRGSNMWGDVGVSFYWNSVDDVESGPYLLWLGYDQDNDFEFRLRLQGLASVKAAPKRLELDDFMALIATYGFTDLLAGLFGRDWLSEDAEVTGVDTRPWLGHVFASALSGERELLVDEANSVTVLRT